MTITVNLEHFQFFNFETDFLKTTFFKRLDHHFLVESTKIENATLSYKPGLSEASGKSDRMVNTQRTEFR